jgi:hypothetical protein
MQLILLVVLCALVALFSPLSDARTSGNCNDDGPILNDPSCPNHIGRNNPVVLEVYEVTGSRWYELDWAWTYSYGWQQSQGRPGTGVSRTAKDAIDSFEITCKPAAMSEQDYVNMQIGLCVGKAVASVDAWWYRVFVAIGMTTVQSRCNVKVAEEIAIKGVQTCPQ